MIAYFDRDSSVMPWLPPGPGIFIHLEAEVSNDSTRNFL